MAGESPDKAEQQGSSQETAASGGGRDPRLSVLRGSESSPSSAVQVDQPTAVFKNLTPRTPEDDEPKTDAEPEPEPEAESKTESGAEPGAEGDRLKAAVAAWVATEEPEESKASKAKAPVEETEPEPEPQEADEPEPGAEADDSEAKDEPQDDEPDEEPEDGPEEEDDESDDETDEESVEDVEDKASVGGAEDKAPSAPWFAARKPAADGKPAEPSDATDSTDSSDETDSTDSSDETDSSDSSDSSEDEEPVDQPTTMFKMVRPPVVDQPTTALKLPSGLTADSDSERTSVFRALRPDIPAEQKAEKAQKAAQEAAKASAAPAAAPKAPEAPKAPASKEPAPAPVPSPASLAEAERTRQQPLPPLPPLDLLAELTNTPPPPPSPLRTALRRVRIWTPLVLLLLIVFAIVQMARPLPPPALTLSAEPTFTFGGGKLQMPWPTEGQGAVEVEGVGSMGLYGAQKPAPIASVTKTMTAYVILRDHPIKGKQQGPEIAVDKKAADQAKHASESTAPVQEGQSYTEKELLELLMIPSANNVARLLARWDAGSEAAFVEKMNAAAKDLGMTQSTYTDPSGLLDSTMSTPQDQLKLAKAVMQYDVFREIVNMPNVTVDGIPGRIENNNNILLQPGVSGIKTGSSTPAGGNLLWAANTVVDGQNRRILGIVMGAKDAKLLIDKLQLAIDNSLKLIQQAQKDITSAAVVKKGEVLGYVDDGLGGRTPVVATKELKAVGWPGLEVKLDLTDGGKALPHSGKAGDIVGQVSIGTGAGKVSSPVALQADLVEPGFDKKLTRLG
ncbi:D-alanyl-D-alanine carboxypeptidase family protein [Streptomyces globisporus]|uniref:D-alanyl-D-alanine carboxypeptidase family protein n=1 Tax=Streptomyces globisporus TaxID=1908 RepID=UPI0004CAE3E9|nr:serine hydrolase [Streptomyces globisporus]